MIKKSSPGKAMVSSPKSSTPPIQVRKKMETYRQAPRQSHEKTGRVKSEVDHTLKEGRDMVRN